MKRTLCLLATTIVLLCTLLAGCAQPGSESVTPEPAKNTIKTGTLSIATDTLDRTRSYNSAKIKYFNVTISGMGITDVVATDIPVSQLNNRSFEVEVVNNAIIKLEPLTIDKTPVLGVSGTATGIWGYTNIVENVTTTVEISRKTTYTALVLKKLLDTGYDLTTYDPAALQTAFEGAMVDTTVNPESFDITTIAANITTTPTYATIDTLATYSVSGTITHPSNSVDNVSVSLNAPFIQPVKTAVDGRFTFNNVAPGTWVITVADGGTQTITLAEDGTLTPPVITIAKVNNAPVIYRSGITTFMDNDVQKLVVAAEVNDLDGLHDIPDVSVVMPAGHSPASYDLSDDGTGLLYDTTAGDGIYETVITGSLSIDDYILECRDQTGALTDVTIDTAGDFLTSPVLVNLANGDVTTDQTPLIDWDPVPGASFYDLQIISAASVIVAEKTAVTVTQADITTMLEGTYTLKLYAHNTLDSFVERVGYREITFTVTAAGGPLGAGIVEARYSDVKNIYYYDHPNFKRVNLAQDTVTTLFSDPGRICDYSPDETEILFSNDVGELYRMRLDGTRKFLLFNTTDIYEAHWSPDGSLIAVVKNDNYQYSLYVMNADGSNCRFYDAPEPTDMYFSADSKSILFNYGRVLYSLDLATGMNTQIFDHTDFYVYIVSDDGTKIAFYDSNILYSINTDGTDFLQIVSAAYDIEDVCFTPDNKLVYLTADNKIYIADSNTADIPRELPTGLSDRWIREVSCSPDGSLIYFLVHSVGIYRMDIDGAVAPERVPSTYGYRSFYLSTITY